MGVTNIAPQSRSPLLNVTRRPKILAVKPVEVADEWAPVYVHPDAKGSPGLRSHELYKAWPLGHAKPFLSNVADYLSQDLCSPQIKQTLNLTFPI